MSSDDKFSCLASSHVTHVFPWLNHTNKNLWIFVVMKFKYVIRMSQRKIVQLESSLDLPSCKFVQTKRTKKAGIVGKYG